MTRDDLINAIDSPTVGDLAKVFSPRNTNPRPYSEQIVELLAPRLVSHAQDERAQPVAWRVHYCGQWLYFENEAACEIYCHSNNKAEPLYQSQAKEPEASGGLCTDAPHAVRVGEPARPGKLSWPAQGRTSNVSELGVTAGETAPNSGCLTPAEGDDAGDAATLRGFIKTFGATPSMVASDRDHWKRRAEQAEALVEDAKEQIEDLNSTMAAWFDLSKKTEEAVTPILIDGLKGYLRTSRNGGMPSELADRVEAVLEDFCRLYVGKALLPVLRGLSPSSTVGSGK